MGAEKEASPVMQSVVLDPTIYRAFKTKATSEGKYVNQALNDLIAEDVGLPSRPIHTGRTRKTARSA